MKYINRIYFFAFFLVNFNINIIAVKPLLVAATETAVEGGNTILKENLPAITVALTGVGTELGRNIGVGDLETIGTGVTKTAAAAKAVAEAVIAAPVTPYIVGLVVVGGVGYMGYRYYNPSPEGIIALKEATLKKCLEENQTSARASSGVPCACQGAACSLSLAAGHKKVDEIVENFNKYAPAQPSQSIAAVAHAVIIAPFDCTIGALANRSGLASSVASLEFVKNDSCYSATIGNGAVNVGKYALAAAAAYCVYRGIKAAYNYATGPEKK